MKLTTDMKILIVGLGVMGGGYAMALSKKGYSVSCLTKNQEDIDYALARGMITEGTTEVSEDLLHKADLIVFALYPDTFLRWIGEHGAKIKPGTLITDVTGVKSTVVETAQALLPDGVEFIATHPMAGRERSGVAYADDAVFERANFIVTPTERNTPEAIELAKELGYTLGFATVSELSPKEHDEMIAFLSQLTHCIAVTLMTCNEAPSLEKYTGDSFRDLTRIAKINDVMWSELFLLNRDALLHEMDAFMAEFAEFRHMLATGDRDGMQKKMRLSTERRSKFDKPPEKKG